MKEVDFLTQGLILADIGKLRYLIRISNIGKLEKITKINGGNILMKQNDDKKHTS